MNKTEKNLKELTDDVKKLRQEQQFGYMTQAGLTEIQSAEDLLQERRRLDRIQEAADLIQEQLEKQHQLIRRGQLLLTARAPVRGQQGQ